MVEVDEGSVPKVEGELVLTDNDMSDPVTLGNTNWTELSADSQAKLQEVYGSPVRVKSGFTTTNRDMAGWCPENEPAMVALSKDQAHWSRYNLTVVNESILHFYLGGNPRIIPTRLIVGEGGGVLLPGQMYTEFSDHLNPKSLGQAIAKGAQGHGEGRGSFGTFHLGFNDKNINDPIQLTPLRCITKGPAHTHTYGTVNVGMGLLRNIVTDVYTEVFKDEEDLYEALGKDIKEQFKKTEQTVKVKAKLALLRHKGDPNESLLARAGVTQLKERQAVVVQPGTEMEAILDPIGYHNLGYKNYILKHGGDYFFCPAKDLEVIKTSDG